MFIKYCANNRSVAVSSTSITTGFHSSHFTPSSNRFNCVCTVCIVCIAFSSLFSAFSSLSSMVGVDSHSNPWDPTLLPPSLAYNACRLRCGTCENARRATSTPISWPRIGEIAAGRDITPFLSRAKAKRDSLLGRKKFMSEYILYADVPDCVGSIAGVLTKLTKEGISIENLTVVHSREGTGGALRLEFRDETDYNKAKEILS